MTYFHEETTYFHDVSFGIPMKDLFNFGAFFLASRLNPLLNTDHYDECIGLAHDVCSNKKLNRFQTEALLILLGRIPDNENYLPHKIGIAQRVAIEKEGSEEGWCALKDYFAAYAKWPVAKHAAQSVATVRSYFPSAKADVLLSSNKNGLSRFFSRPSQYTWGESVIEKLPDICSRGWGGLLMAPASVEAINAEYPDPDARRAVFISIAEKNSDNLLGWACVNAVVQGLPKTEALPSGPRSKASRMLKVFGQSRRASLKRNPGNAFDRLNALNKMVPYADPFQKKEIAWRMACAAQNVSTPDYKIVALMLAAKRIDEDFLYRRFNVGDIEGRALSWIAKSVEKTLSRQEVCSQVALFVAGASRSDICHPQIRHVAERALSPIKYISEGVLQKYSEKLGL